MKITIKIIFAFTIMGIGALSFSRCTPSSRSIKSFKNFADLLEYSKKQACSEKENFLVVYNYDGTEYTPKIMNPCKFSLANYNKRNLSYISMRDREDGINLSEHTQIVKKQMDEFVNNMGANPIWSESPDKAIFVLELNASTSIKNLNQYLMALSVVYEEIIHFRYRDQMKGIPVILTSKELYSEN